MIGPDISASVRARLWVLASHADFDGDTLTRAIHATFDRRATPIPAGVPLGLTGAFAKDPQKQTQWRAFLARNALAPVVLADLLDLLRGFLMPPLQAVRTHAPPPVQWTAGDGWR